MASSLAEWRRAVPDAGDALAGAVLIAAILLAASGGGAGPFGLPDTHRALPAVTLLAVALLLFGRRRLPVWRRPSEAATRKRIGQPVPTDPLTGLANRSGLIDAGRELLASATRRGEAVALLALELDRFRTVNDLHGHVVGDALLRQVADALTKTLPPCAIAARLSGVQFACLLAFDPADTLPVSRLAEKLVSHLSQPILCSGLELRIRASVGVARSDFGGATIDALMDSGEIALAAAKLAGGNRLSWFEPALERDLQARAQFEDRLRAAIPKQEIVPYFEPQVSLATGQLTGFEVLARWEHPTEGLIEPDRFIPIAEDSGLIDELSLSVMRQALLAARDWHPDLTVAINISPHQLGDAWLAQKIIKLLTETGFPARRLQVEITEAALFDNLALAQSIVGSLKNQGITLALDDFGTGYSSIGHLRALPFDCIKIDRSFVLSMADRADSAAIVQAIVGVGDSLNLPVTAEGVESSAIEDRLRGLGCAKGQGWRYGKPLPAAGVRTLLAAQRQLACSPTADDNVTSRRLAG